MIKLKPYENQEYVNQNPSPPKNHFLCYSVYFNFVRFSYVNKLENDDAQVNVLILTNFKTARFWLVRTTFFTWLRYCYSTEIKLSLNERETPNL